MTARFQTQRKPALNHRRGATVLTVNHSFASGSAHGGKCWLLPPDPADCPTSLREGRKSERLLAAVLDAPAAFSTLNMPGTGDAQTEMSPGGLPLPSPPQRRRGAQPISRSARRRADPRRCAHSSRSGRLEGRPARGLEAKRYVQPGVCGSWLGARRMEREPARLRPRRATPGCPPAHAAREPRTRRRHRRAAAGRPR